MGRIITCREPHKTLCPHTVYRLVPCPLYAIEELECWLGEMAAKGLVLSKDGFFAGFAIFERRNPCILRYRLDAAPKELSFWSPEDSRPNDEALELAQAAGWQFVAVRGQFYVYCCADPEAPELNTDPRVQALAIQEVRRRLRSSLIGNLIVLAANGFRLFVSPLLLMLELGSWFGLLTVLFMLWLFFGSLSDIRHLRRLHRQLRGGRSLDHQKNWRPSLRKRLLRAGIWTLAALWCLWLFTGKQEALLERNRTPLAEYAGELPFATVAQLRPGIDCISSVPDDLAGMIDDSNQINWYSDPLAPLVIKYDEISLVTWADGHRLSADWEVDYYQLRSPLLASLLVRDIARHDRFSGYRVTPLSLDGIDADDCIAYSNVFPTVILRQGCRVARFRLMQFSASSPELTLEQWAAAAAQSLKEQ